MTATLRTDFDAFLFASIGEDTNGMPLTLLSVLAAFLLFGMLDAVRSAFNAPPSAAGTNFTPPWSATSCDSGNRARGKSS